MQVNSFEYKENEKKSESELVVFISGYELMRSNIVSTANVWPKIVYSCIISK